MRPDITSGRADRRDLFNSEHQHAAPLLLRGRSAARRNEHRLQPRADGRSAPSCLAMPRSTVTSIVKLIASAKLPAPRVAAGLRPCRRVQRHWRSTTNSRRRLNAGGGRRARRQSSSAADIKSLSDEARQTLATLTTLFGPAKTVLQQRPCGTAAATRSPLRSIFGGRRHRHRRGRRRNVSLDLADLPGSIAPGSSLSPICRAPLTLAPRRPPTAWAKPTTHGNTRARPATGFSFVDLRALTEILNPALNVGQFPRPGTGCA